MAFTESLSFDRQLWRDDGRQIGRGDGHAGLRVDDVVAEFLGAVHRVDGHDDCVEP